MATRLTRNDALWRGLRLASLSQPAAPPTPQPRTFSGCPPGPHRVDQLIAYRDVSSPIAVALGFIGRDQMNTARRVSSEPPRQRILRGNQSAARRPTVTLTTSRCDPTRGEQRQPLTHRGHQLLVRERPEPLALRPLLPGCSKQRRHQDRCVSSLSVPCLQHEVLVGYTQHDFQFHSAAFSGVQTVTGRRSAETGETVGVVRTLLN
jgi:hypothetical protein